VSGLARALGALGHEVTCVLPAYQSALTTAALPRLLDGGPVQLSFPSFSLQGRFLTGTLFPGVAVDLLDLPQLYDRSGVYGEKGRDYDDNPLRYIALARAAAYRAEQAMPDVVVAHDWHAALVCAVLRTSLDRGAVRGIGAVQVVHNNAHQGRVASANMAFTGLAADLFHPDGVEAWGSLCLLKAGVNYADRVVAVSPTYARVVQTRDFGEVLEGEYRPRAHRLHGIVNGIDTQRFDPGTDHALAATYDEQNLDGKALCRTDLLDAFGLDAPPPGLLLAGIGRLANQKGWDIILSSLDGLLALGATCVFLGDGSAELSGALTRRAAQSPRRIRFHAGYDDALARRIYAGADAMLIPSRFEPCGLVQLIAQRYGTVPIGHATGGRVDTIRDPWSQPVRAGTDAHDPWKRATGALFAPLTRDNLVFACERIKKLGETGRLPEVQRRLLELDVSWDGPAQSWLAVLEEASFEARRRL
jgi:starch synthase